MVLIRGRRDRAGIYAFMQVRAPAPSCGATVLPFPANRPECRAMDWDALWLSLRLGGLTVLALIPLAVALGRWLAVRSFRGKAIVGRLRCHWSCRDRARLLSAGGVRIGSWLGQAYERLFGHTLVFSFQDFSSPLSSSTSRLPCSRYNAPSRLSHRTATPPRHVACHGGAWYGGSSCRSPGPAS
jgi:hypothetical protein